MTAPASFDFVVVGAGSSGAVLAARLSEDPKVSVCLLEAGHAPPPAELMPLDCAALQGSPDTDWQFTARAGRCGLGLATPGVMPQPRGKMLGGSSGMNYLAYVRGHPGDFDSWAAKGAAGWSYTEVLPYFKKSEGCVFPAHVAKEDFVLDASAHSQAGPLGVSVRQPVLRAAKDFVTACSADGLPVIDYNGSTRGGPTGGASLFQTTTKAGKRSSTYHAFLVPALHRENLTILAGTTVTRVLLEGQRAVGVEYQAESGGVLAAEREVILCGGAFGSPHLLLCSGIGPRSELEAVGVQCHLDSPHVGKHLKDHFQLALFYHAPGVGVSVQEVGMSMGADALRQAGALPANPVDDATMPVDLQRVKVEAERRLQEWAVDGTGLASSSLYEACCFYNTGFGDEHSHDAQLSVFACGNNIDMWQRCLKVDLTKYFGNEVETERALGLDKQNILLLANPVLPRSEGHVRLASADPSVPPEIDANYFSDPHDMKVTVACVRRLMGIAEKWPGAGLGALRVPKVIRERHGYTDGEPLSDALIEDFALHFALTVYHATSTCRIGEVVDPQLRVRGLQGLRVADASVMPDIISGNTNAACIMIGEKAAEMIAVEHGLALSEFVGNPNASSSF